MTMAGVTEYVKELRQPKKSKQKGRRSKSLANSTIKHRLQILASAFELENAAREEARLDPLIVPRFPKLPDGDARSGFLTERSSTYSDPTCLMIYETSLCLLM